eukprot:TRINITY_DN2821_c0_g1_i11.p1 TRINITY_DN2821_c0_g1~~TRINITY_DN2821_c0_g1_i11.p1  ORF type:complete len:270 (-),score=67.19 TRINITY_DN2821_c0_g1_i11:103-912(-)
MSNFASVVLPLFCSKESKFSEIYCTYSTVYMKGVSILEKYSSYPDVQEFLNSMIKPGVQTLQSYLISPIKRPLRIGLIMDNILKILSPVQVEFPIYQMTFILMKETTNKIDNLLALPLVDVRCCVCVGPTCTCDFICPGCERAMRVCWCVGGGGGGGSSIGGSYADSDGDVDGYSGGGVGSGGGEDSSNQEGRLSRRTSQVDDSDGLPPADGSVGAVLTVSGSSGSLENDGLDSHDFWLFPWSLSQPVIMLVFCLGVGILVYHWNTKRT